MKKLVSLVLALTLILTLGAASAATFYPKGDPNRAMTSGVLEFSKFGGFEDGQSLAVYTGPGKYYHRVNWAKMSTSGTCNLAGLENGWALVMYSKSNGGVRVGYVNTDELLYRVNGRKLEFNKTSRTVRRSCVLTDDPVRESESVVYLDAGDSVTWLASYSGYREWAYVEVVVDKVPVRGFIPADCL